MKDWKIIVALLIGGAVLTLARRWKNPSDRYAGSGVAGWTMFIVIKYLL